MENKKDIENIYHNDVLVASIIRPLQSKDGLSFFTHDDNFIQVGVWNYEAGEKLPAHYHTEFERKAYKTNESVLVLKGEIICNLYTKSGNLIKKLVINEGEMIAQFNEAHEYIIQKDSIVVETKNGPYFGPDKDRVRIDTK